MKYHGYKTEEHFVTTDDGYILTIFRCNSRRIPINHKKPLIIQHGIASSSDDLTTNIPSQAVGTYF